MTLTKGDLKQIGSLVEKKLRKQEKKIDEKFRVQRENITLDLADHMDKTLEKFTDEFFTKIDPILKEVQDSRQERTLIERRITALEDTKVQ